MPALNSTMAAMYTVRVLSRCSRNPVVGMTTAIVSRNAVVSHCPTDGGTPRSSMMGGSATFITVSLRKTTNVETSRSAMTIVFLRECSGASGASVAATSVSAVARGWFVLHWSLLVSHLVSSSLRGGFRMCSTVNDG